ncbi:MAG: MFS transporter [Oscillospiraceae bacterium]|nr:MFS transporter [Oscillospiraceae bacterium]
MDKELIKKEKRARISWYFYDFGNSSYASIILLAVFSIYFKNVVVGDGAEGTRLWGLSVGIAAAVVAIISPILGTIADFTRGKKKFMIIFTLLSCVFTTCLFFVGKGDVFLAMLFFILAELGYRASQVFYDALLPEVSTPETIGKVSGIGWAVGMLGGILALVAVLIPIQLLDGFFVPISFLIAAAFFLFASLPSFFWVPETQEATGIPEGESALKHAFKNLADTFRDAKSYREFIKYMFSYLIYNDGIMMLMDFAAIIGGTLFGLGDTDLILLIILLQITGAIGAWIFGIMADKRSGKESVLISLVVLILSILAIFFITSVTWFFVASSIAGFALSAAQAVSRSIVVQLAPLEKVAEFNGFLSTAGRTSTFIGPLVFGALSFRMSNYYENRGQVLAVAERNGMMWGMGAIIAFLVVGCLLLFTVKRIHVENVSEQEEA